MNSLSCFVDRDVFDRCMFVLRGRIVILASCGVYLTCSYFMSVWVAIIGTILLETPFATPINILISQQWQPRNTAWNGLSLPTFRRLNLQMDMTYNDGAVALLFLFRDKVHEHTFYVYHFSWSTKNMFACTSTHTHATVAHTRHTN